MEQEKFISIAEAVLCEANSFENVPVSFVVSYIPLSTIRCALESRREEEHFLQKELNPGSRKNEENIISVLLERIDLSIHQGTKKFGIPLCISYTELEKMNRIIIEEIDIDEAIRGEFPEDILQASISLNRSFEEETGRKSKVFCQFINHLRNYYPYYDFSA